MEAGGAPGTSGRPWARVVDEGRGHVAADEAAGEEGSGGGFAANAATGPSRGDVVSVDKAARTTLGDVVADVVAAGGG